MRVASLPHARRAPLEASYVRRLVARPGREAGIERVVNARTLRESYAAARLFRVRRPAVGERIVMSFEDQGAARAAERHVGRLEAAGGDARGLAGR